MADVVAVISWQQACARRLERHGLQAPLPSIPDAASAMCGAHAQIMSAAEVSIGVRVDGVTRSDVARALWDDRSLVKTFGPRGTVHLLPAADLARWCAALSAVPTSSSQAVAVKLDAAQTDAVVAAIADALADAELTVDELDLAVAERCGAWAGELVMPAFGGFWPRWRQAVATAATRGALCFGPNRGRRVTYASPGRWLVSVTPDDALARLVHDYLHSYGPATPAHFAQWLAAPTPWARTLFEQQGLDEVDLGGEPAWVNSGDTDFGQPAPGIRLLPYFDAFAVGSHPRRLLYAGGAAERALAGSQAGNFPVLLIDGAVAGVWHQRRVGRRIAVTVEPLGRLTAKHRKAVADEVDKIGFILEGRAELTFGSVTVGPHA
jgi:hypothetical protein